MSMLRRTFLASSTALAATSPAFAQPARRGTEILWDRYGVAHVFAQDAAGLFHGYGWAQTKSHGDVLLKLYAQARGRAAEYYGPAELKNDRWMAVHGVWARARDWLDRQTPEFRRCLDAFAAGINDHAAAHPGQLSDAARQVLPVDAQDVVAYAHRLFQFVYLASADVADRLPQDAAPEKEPSGSNGWAVGPSRSANGAAMMLMNPHLPWAPGWSTYYEAHLTAPGIDLYGASQVGLPVLRFMFSDDIAFTHTVNSINGATYYKLALAEGGYRFDGAVRPFTVRTHRLKVRRPDGGFDTEAVEVRESIHGPVIGERDGAPIALRVAGLDRPFALDQYWKMALAKSFGEYEAQVRRLQVPTFNILFAGRDGHIQYLYNGLVPRRRSGDFAYWTRVVPGDTSAYLWTDYLTYDELPKATDPTGGTVQNSNDPPWNTAWPQVIDPAPYAAFIPQQFVSLRAASAIRMLGEKPKISFEDLVVSKWSTRSELADRILPALIAAARTHGTPLARQAADVLERWDRTTQAGSRGALLFVNWSDRPGGVGGYAGAGWATPYNVREPLTTPSGLADPIAAARTLDLAAQAMLKTYGALDHPWGAALRLRGPGVDLPASGGPGRIGVFDVVEQREGTPSETAAKPDGTRTADFGSSFSAVVRFDGPRARAKVLTSYGTSSQRGSPHAADQLPLLARQDLRDAWRERAEIEANLALRERL